MIPNNLKSLLHFWLVKTVSLILQHPTKFSVSERFLTMISWSAFELHSSEKEIKRSNFEGKYFSIEIYPSSLKPNLSSPGSIIEMSPGKKDKIGLFMMIAFVNC